MATATGAATAYSIKRIIGRSFSDTRVGKAVEGKPFDVQAVDGRPHVVVNYGTQSEVLAPETISAVVLGRMKEIAEQQLGETVRKAVVTVPAYFGNEQRVATKQAAEIAGLEAIRVINEPTAAALAYGLSEEESGGADLDRHVLVFDLGGGTFDVSVLRLDGGTFEVEATGGDGFLGGDDWTDKLATFVGGEFTRQTGHSLAGNTRARQRLRAAAEQLKEALSMREVAEVQIDSLAGNSDCTMNVTRARFNALCKDLFARTMTKVEAVMVEACVTVSDIHSVVLAGGSTRLPEVHQLLAAKFGVERICRTVNPDEAVAYGAAVQGAILSGADAHGTLDDVVLLDATSHALGVSVVGGRFSTVVPKNSLLPSRKSSGYTTTTDEQTAVHIAVYEGDCEMVEGNTLVGEFTVNEIPRLPAGKASLKTTFDVDVNGMLHVTSEETSSGAGGCISIQRQDSALPNERVEALRAREEEAKARYRSERIRVDAWAALQQYGVRLRSVLRWPGGKDALSASEIRALEMESSAVKTWLERNPAEPKEEYKRRLNRAKEATSEPLARAEAGVSALLKRRDRNPPEPSSRWRSSQFASEMD